MPPPDDTIGRTFAGKYRVEQMIGEGGMGKVYKATQLALDKPVVLKVLRQALLGDERTVARFQREAKAASRLNHPNSISVLDFGQADDGAMYIAMEYVQGKDLHQILSREWPLPESRVMRLMSQVLSALADAHSVGVIHRDLKPENIMVSQGRSEPDFVKVLDFGIAKIVDGSDEEGPALTRAGFVCGTPEYMSPEQARGAKLDHRSDLYAVGVILYQLVSGMLPFDSDSAVGFATKHLTEIPPPPTKRRPDARVSPAMERLIMKALSKNPDERPQTAEQFRAELLAIDKERRAAVGRRSGPHSAPSLAPIARKVTPLDQQETKVSGPPPGMPSSPWSQRDDTVKHSPEPMTSPGQSTLPTSVPQNIARTTVEGTGALVFKVATVVLVLLALLLAGAYAVQVFNPSKELFVPGEPAEPPSNAPIPGGSRRNLWDEELPKIERRKDDAQRALSLGDAHFVRGDFRRAAGEYEKAWRVDPRPEIALRLGEVARLESATTETSGWWGRYREMNPGGASVVREYIHERLGP
ncbi:MAG: serine/threonine-protein kinase [Myxococcales bacterium]|nr:serine/threonine-protein kinase [Myxococcales bacterium]